MASPFARARQIEGEIVGLGPTGRMCSYQSKRGVKTKVPMFQCRKGKDHNHCSIGKKKKKSVETYTTAKTKHLSGHNTNKLEVC